MRTEQSHRRQSDQGKDISDPYVDKRTIELVDEYFQDLVPNLEENPELKEKILHKMNGLAKLVSEAEQKSEKDSRTGLLNKEAFFKKYKSALKERTSKNSYTFMISIDLDHLKRINLLAGDEAGDAAIAAVTVALKKVLRKKDIPACVGGDEFMALLSEVPTREKALELMTKITDAVSKTTIAGYDRKLSMSIGCVEIPFADLPSPREIANLSETARKLSKVHGRGAYTIIAVRGGVDDEHITGPKVSYETRKFGRDRESNPTYAHILQSGDIETARTSRDQCRYDVLGSLDRVFAEIEGAYNGNMQELLAHYQVERLTKLNVEQLEEILFQVRNIGYGPAHL